MRIISTGVIGKHPGEFTGRQWGELAASLGGAIAEAHGWRR